mmetsp:Transcript_123975/g.194345  ORF Transcript_123975/g.194345 Transcript_123975/m.194345 type:complete len:225 (-) Transcript_123975:878-1552(-)
MSWRSTCLFCLSSGLPASSETSLRGRPLDRSLIIFVSASLVHWTCISLDSSMSNRNCASYSATLWMKWCNDLPCCRKSFEVGLRGNTMISTVSKSLRLAMRSCELTDENEVCRNFPSKPIFSRCRFSLSTRRSSISSLHLRSSDSTLARSQVKLSVEFCNAWKSWRARRELLSKDSNDCSLDSACRETSDNSSCTSRTRLSASASISLRSFSSLATVDCKSLQS